MHSENGWFGTVDLLDEVDGKDTAYLDEAMYDGGDYPITAPADIICAVVDDRVYAWFMANDPYPTWEDLLREPTETPTEMPTVTPAATEIAPLQVERLEKVV